MTGLSLLSDSCRKSGISRFHGTQACRDGRLSGDGLSGTPRRKDQRGVLRFRCSMERSLMYNFIICSDCRCDFSTKIDKIAGSWANDAIFLPTMPKKTQGLCLYETQPLYSVSSIFVLKSHRQSLQIMKLYIKLLSLVAVMALSMTSCDLYKPACHEIEICLISYSCHFLNGSGV